MKSDLNEINLFPMTFPSKQQKLNFNWTITAFSINFREVGGGGLANDLVKTIVVPHPLHSWST